MPAKDQGMEDRAGKSQIRREFQEHTRKLFLNLLRDPVEENRNVSVGSSNTEILHDPEKFHRSEWWAKTANCNGVKSKWVIKSYSTSRRHFRNSALKGVREMRWGTLGSRQVFASLIFNVRGTGSWIHLFLQLFKQYLLSTRTMSLWSLRSPADRGNKQIHTY